MEPNDFREFGPDCEYLVWRRDQLSSIQPAAKRAEEADLLERLNDALAILPAHQRDSLLAQRRFGGAENAIHDVMRKYGRSDATIYNWGAAALDWLKDRLARNRPNAPRQNQFG